MNNRVREQYDRLASSYDERWRSYVSDTLAFLKDYLRLSGDERVLDVACGTGELERILLAEYPGLDIIGVDLSENMLEVARRKPTANQNATFEQGSAEELPFSDESFDLVVSANSFHYFDDPLVSLREMRRILEPGSQAVILDWCKDFAACRLCDLALKTLDPAYKQCYRQRELREMFHHAGFEVTDENTRRIRLIWGLMLTTGLRP